MENEKPQKDIKRMSLIKNPSSFDLVIPKNVEEKIRHLCNKVHNAEWSGILFYKTSGSLDNGTFKATCLDIFVMDIGNSTYTEYDDSEDIIAYRLEHKDTLLKPGVYEGLIHSHNTFQSFFSCTDNSTLIQEGSDLNHFLSLIVNNAGQYVARITRKLTSRIKADAHIIYTKSSEYNTFENKKVVLDTSVEEVDKTKETVETVIEYFDLVIDKHEVSNKFQELDNRLDEIAESKTVFTKKKKAEKPSNVPTQLSLFHGFSKENEEGVDNDFEKAYLTEIVPNNILLSLCTQLLYGSPLAGKPKDIKTLVNSLDDLYLKRFGSDDIELTNYRIETWIECLIEHVIGYSVNKKYEDSLALKYGLGNNYDYNEDDSFIRIYAYNIIRYLETLPESDTVNTIIHCLDNLLPYKTIKK